MIVNCLGVLAAVPGLPGPAPEAAAAPAHPAAVGTAPAAPSGMPAAPPAVPTSSPPPLRAAPSPVTVAVAPAGTPAPGYRINIRNTGDTPVDTTVRQELPPGSSATTVTAGGRASRPAGATTAGEVTWQLKLPAHSTTTLHTALSAPAGRPVTAPACAYGTDGTRPYDCGTATWQAAAVPVAKVSAAPAWRRPPVLLAALAALLVVTGGVLWWWLRRRRSGGPARPGTPTTAGGAGDPAGHGAVYPRPAMPAPGGRRRTPSVWLVVPVSAAVLAGVVGAGAWTATQRVAAIDTAKKQPTSGAWQGQSVTGGLGEPLRESAFEFTVYRVACAPGPTTGTAGTTGSAGPTGTPGPAGTAGAPGTTGAAGGRQCQATVGVRNLTPEEQTWHGQLQRAYLPGGNWVSTDEDATRLANLGRDVFAQPVAAGTRVVLPLVFSTGSTPPRQLELRSGVFSAGVRVDVP
ncbi:hypothetical protein VK199_16865 [Micromonospora sp. CCTCC AA 2012012]|uniref:DUF11 domain-containing protein n=1 Tax=Micromonospora sp. CCTCC AA 2012012 TaxID=3111921 RepID=A0AAU8H685_9ACTN